MSEADRAGSPPWVRRRGRRQNRLRGSSRKRRQFFTLCPKKCAEHTLECREASKKAALMVVCKMRYQGFNAFMVLVIKKADRRRAPLGYEIRGLGL
jgi:hypothetical protein